MWIHVRDSIDKVSPKDNFVEDLDNAPIQVAYNLFYLAGKLFFALLEHYHSGTPSLSKMWKALTFEFAQVLVLKRIDLRQ